VSKRKKENVSQKKKNKKGVVKKSWRRGQLNPGKTLIAA